MMNIFQNLKLKGKLLLAFGAILLLSVFMMYQSWNTIKKIDSYQTVSELIDGVQIDLLKLDLAVKGFIFDGYKSTDFHDKNKSSQIEVFNAELAKAKASLETVKESEFLYQDSSVQKLMRVLPKLDEQFTQVTELFKARGFKDFGLEGKLRASIHNVENSSFPYNKADMLTLRRHEKDFFLRKDLKYQNEFNKKVDEFIESIAKRGGSIDQQKIIDQLKDYKEKFNEVVVIDAQIGLQEQDGIKKTIHQDLATIQNSIEALREFAKKDSARFKRQSIATLFVLFVLQLGIGLALASYCTKRVTHSVLQLRDAIKTFASGAFPAKLEINGKDEAEETKASFNQLLDRIKAAQQFSQHLGNGELSAAYHESFREDSLAQSLIKMQGALHEANEKQRIINWTNYGAAQLNEILKNDHAQIQSLGDNILKTLVQYLGANQGALYLVAVQGDELVADRISTYAFNKKRFVEHIQAGQGIVGQCLLEKEMILLTDIPKSYTHITSGLGGSAPKFIIVLPLLFREEIVGILEMASFERQAAYQIDFLKKIAENIASILYNKKMSSETTRLLEEARQQAQQLATQEEEIRQNAEEMLAIQEQLAREKKILEDENQHLKELLNSELQEN